MPPLLAGLGLKPEFFEQALAERAPGQWWEVHPENYAVGGGPRRAWLEAIRREHPLSLHGVSLSLAGVHAPPPEGLQSLADLVRSLAPALVSDHLAWSWHAGRYAPDLLPVQRDLATLQRLCRRLDEVQNALGRPLAIENPSHYLPLAHEWDEVDFLHEVHRRTGCQLLVDLNNLVVSAHNVGQDAQDWVDRVRADAVVELHLAGHQPDAASNLLIDSHDTSVGEAAWALHERLIRRIGPRPTLIERDAQLPPYAQLQAECARARQQLLAASAQQGSSHVA